MRTSRAPAVLSNRSPTWATGAIAAIPQSSSPTAASENRPSLGGVSFARPMFNADARSGPYQGIARAPFTGVRVVATRRTGSVERPDESKGGAFDAKPAHPASASGEPADAR